MGSLSEILFVAAAIIGLVSSRIFLFGTGEDGVNASALRRSLGLVSMALTYSLFAWGFVSLSWYWPVGRLSGWLPSSLPSSSHSRRGASCIRTGRLWTSRRSPRAAICGLNIGLSCSRCVRPAALSEVLRRRQDPRRRN